MPAARRSAAAPAGSTFPSPASPGLNRTRIHCVCLLGRSSPGLDGCTQTGSKGRSARTACTNADQTRTSGIARMSHSNSPAAPRTPRNARPSACPACSSAAVQTSGLFAVSASQTFSSLRSRNPGVQNPGIRAGGTCDRTKTPPQTDSFSAFASSCTRASLPPICTGGSFDSRQPFSLSPHLLLAGVHELSFTYPGATIRTRIYLGGSYGGS